MLRRGANTNIRDNEGKTILDHAEACGHLDIIQLYKQFLSRSLPLDDTLTMKDLSTSEIYMTPNSKLVAYNKSVLTGSVFSKCFLQTDSDPETDDQGFSSTEDDLLLSDLEIKKALNKHALVEKKLLEETSGPETTNHESSTGTSRKKERNERRKKKEQDTLEQLIETTQEMEEALKSLEHQNEDLNEQLMEKEILLNLAQKELEGIKVRSHFFFKS